MPQTSPLHVIDYARAQLAAEAFLARTENSGALPDSEAELERFLAAGNTHASRFSASEARNFLSRFEVLAQVRNDPLLGGGAGFSGTLVRRRDTGELILSFRSTEFIDDAVRDSKATNDLELRQLGWGFGQIVEMEDWYAQLRSDPALLQGQQFTVTGYSLGGHLATAFNILRREAEERGEEANPIIGTYTFNGAGVGNIKDGASLTSVISAFRRYRDPGLLAVDPYWLSLPEPERERYRLEAGARAVEVRREQDRIRNLAGVRYALDATVPPLGVQSTAEYQLAAVLAGRLADPMASFPFFDGVNDIPTSPKFAEEFGRVRFPSMLELVGSDGGRLGPSFVSNSGIHYGTRQEVYIEDQPLERGTYSVVRSQGRLEANPAVNDFADTHSLILILDSLSLMSAFESIDPTLSSSTINRILAASSNARVHVGVDDQHEAEGDTLERTLDALGAVMLGSGADRFARYGEIVRGATWDDEQPRADFQARIDAVLREADANIANGLTTRVVSLVGLGTEEIVSRAMEDSSEGAAYRLALKSLSPFAILGLNYGSDPRFPDLSLASAGTPSGMTGEYLQARAAFLAAFMARNVGNLALAPGSIDKRFLFEDRATPSGMNPGEWMQVSQLPDATVSIADLGAVQQLGQVARHERVVSATRNQLGAGHVQLVSFGSTGDDNVLGGRSDDRLFGEDGADRLDAGEGDDFLDGGRGADILYGRAGDDELVGLDGTDGDRLLGGVGDDTFYVDWGDTVSDTPGEGRGGTVYVGLGKLELIDGYRSGDGSFFDSSNGIRYWEAPDGRIVAFGPEGGKLTIEAPGATVPGLDTSNNVEISGRPDLGIRLVSAVDQDRPRIRQGKDAIPSLWKLARTWVAKGDPLALDLDGDGIETLGGTSGRAVLFDHTADGVRDGSGWLTGDDAWVALDLDGNGMVDNGRELFGIDTILPGGARPRDGFEALASLDSSGDGRIDAADERYEDLLVWRDENLNGISEGYELRSFEEAGIASVNLAATPSGAPLPGGNQLIAAGTYTLADGTMLAAGALDLVRETYYRDFASAPQAAGDLGELPNLRGSGRVRDIGEAAFESPEVLQALEAAATAATRTAQIEKSAQLVEVWAGSSTMATGRRAFAQGSEAPILHLRFQGLSSVDPQVAYLSLTGGNVPLSELPADWFLAAQDDEYRERVRKVEILERFTGQTLARVGTMQGQQVYSSASGDIRLFSGSYSVGAQNFDFLDQAHAALEEQTYLAVALGTRLKPYVDAFMQGRESGAFGELETLLVERREEDFANALEDFVDLARAVGYELVDRGWAQLMPMLDDWIRDARADPAMAAALGSLRVDFRSAAHMRGTGSGDLLFGEHWTPPGATPSAWTTDGSFGDDLIFGGEPRATEISDGEGADLVYGGAEDDTFLAGEGRDIYLFGRGAGHDLATGERLHQAMTALDRDVLQLLPGIDPGDIVVRRAFQPSIGSYALEVRITDTGDSFTDKFFFHSEEARLLDEIRFADGTRWNVAEIRRRVVLGSTGNDNPAHGLPQIFGTPADELLQGFEGDDVLLGDAGDDLLVGGPGEDVLEGYFGRDELDGGPGSDRLYGGHGVDTFVLGRGGGRDEVFRGSFVSNAFSDTQELDVLRVEGDVSPGELLIQWTPGGIRFLLRDGTAEIWDWGSPFNPDFSGAGGTGPSIGRVEFQDGTVWDSAEIRHRGTLGGSDDADELWGYADSGDVLIGGAGNDVLHGQGGDDTLDGGAGNDLLWGGPGADVFLLARGGESDEAVIEGADVIRVHEGIGQAEVLIRKAESGVFVALASDGAEIFARGMPNGVVFSDGAFWNASEIKARTIFPATPDNDWVHGYDDADDVLAGLDGDDLIQGEGGADRLIGGRGNDELFGGAGSDVYVFRRGDGLDWIGDLPGDGEVNILVLEDLVRGDVYRPTENGLRVGRTSDGLNLSSAAAIDWLVYADGGMDRLDDLPATYTPPNDDPEAEGEFLGPGLPLIPYFYGVGEATAGDDWIFGTDVDDVLSGGAGVDVIVGRLGKDTYLFNRGDGLDLLVDNASGDFQSILRFGPGVSASEVQVSENEGVHYFVLTGADEGVAFVGAMPRIEFADASAPSGDSGSDGEEDVHPVDRLVENHDSGEDAIGFVSATSEATVATRAAGEGRGPESAVPDAFPLGGSSPVPDRVVGESSDPIYREIDQRLDTLLQVGRVNLSERYGEAIREFEERRRAKELPADPAGPSDAEIGAWNEVMHAWHERHPGFAESDVGGSVGSAWTSWGLPASTDSIWGGSTSSNSWAPPTLANPHALPGPAPVASAPALSEGLGIRL